MNALSPDRWPQVKAIFHRLGEADQSEWAAMLDELCPDRDVRAEVLSLLEADGESLGFLSRPAVQEMAGSLAAESSAVLPSGHIGPYEVVREIGHGGMGVVFEAVRRDAFHKKVAVKLIRRGMDSDEVVRRFENERQILADLEHPYIARLLDGGTAESGVPYFVMEYVEGLPIDRYCEERRLTVADRLRLFISACSAVQYAHQSLVVHRDLKPSNILVTPAGVPKLLDFGIAKLLDPSRSGQARTAFELRVLTPEYASPEQIAGAAIGTTSDVYSLGVILYELLCGKRPFREFPERPSAVLRRRDMPVDSDLDNVVLKALHADPQRRYGSVQQLADDLVRYLGGLPVTARPDSVSYRLGKFIRRNRIAAGAAAAVALTLVGGIAATAREAQIARAERARAERRFNDVRRMANALMFDLHDSLERLPGSLAARQTLVHRAFVYLDSLAAESPDDDAVAADLASAYDHLGLLTFDTAQSLAAHAKAAEMFRRLVAAHPGNDAYREGLVSALMNTADAQKIDGRARAALAACGEAKVNSVQLVRQHDTVATRRLLESVYIEAGCVNEDSGDVAAALTANRQALAIASGLSAQRPNDATLGHELLVAEAHVGWNLTQLGEARQALLHARKALATAEALSATDPLNPVYRRDVWGTSWKLGRALSLNGDHEAAIEAVQRAQTIIRALAADDPDDIGHRRNLAMTDRELGDVLTAAGRNEEAAVAYEEAREISAKLVAGDPLRLEARSDLAEAEMNLGTLDARRRNTVRALQHVRAGLEISHELATSRPENAAYAADVRHGNDLMAVLRQQVAERQHPNLR